MDDRPGFSSHVLGPPRGPLNFVWRMASQWLADAVSICLFNNPVQQWREHVCVNICCAPVDELVHEKVAK